MLAGLDQGGGRLASAGIQPTVVGQQPGEPSPPGPGGRFTVEQRRKQAQRVDEFAHGGGRIGARCGCQEQLEPRDATFRKSRARDSHAGAAPRFSIGQGVGEIAVPFHGRFLRRQRRTGVRQHGAQQIGKQERQGLGEKALTLIRIGTRQLVPGQWTAQSSGIRRLRHGSSVAAPRIPATVSKCDPLAIQLTSAHATTHRPRGPGGQAARRLFRRRYRLFGRTGMVPIHLR